MIKSRDTGLLFNPLFLVDRNSCPGTLNYCVVTVIKAREEQY